MFSRRKVIDNRVGNAFIVDFVPHPFARNGGIPGRIRAAVHGDVEGVIVAIGCQHPTPHDIVTGGSDLEGVSRITI